MCLKLIFVVRNTLYRSLIGENAFKVFGRVAIGLLLFFTFYSWINVYEILRYTRDKFVSTTQPSILFQQRYLPIGGADLKFNQPWDLGNATILTKFSQLESGERFILSDLAYSPGLGNLMFEYAALNYYAQKHNASIIIPSDCLLLRAFGQLKRILVMDATVLNGYLLYREDKELPIQESKHCCQFLPEMKLFNELNIEVVKGYFQTYEYFNSPELEADIRQSFQFLPGVIQRAEELIQNIKKSLADQLKDRNYTFVGVHVRHGMDVVLHQRNQYHGHVTAPAEYFQHAIIKMRNKFRHQKVVFLIVGDDLNWARASLQKFESIFPGEMQFVKSGFREVDMAVLTLCDHTIMSTGTFSWWIGYLTNGTVFYYGNWPKRGTVLDIMISDSKYFPEPWIPVV